MKTPTLFIESVAFWSSGLPGWDVARAAFRAEAVPLQAAAGRPASALLPANERRRAPETVVLALEVAARAARQAGQDPALMPSVFVSAHGDLAITDGMCKTLAEAPTLMSPTRFHNSVHNAAAGYWTIGTGCMQASTALTAFERSFAAGLLEAATQCVADHRPVLLVGCDIEARGALRSVVRSRGSLAAALVLSPGRTEHSLASLGWSLGRPAGNAAPLRSEAAQALADNAMADALPLLEALANERTEVVHMPLSPMLSLTIQTQALPPRRRVRADGVRRGDEAAQAPAAEPVATTMSPHSANLSGPWAGAAASDGPTP